MFESSGESRLDVAGGVAATDLLCALRRPSRAQTTPNIRQARVERRFASSFRWLVSCMFHGRAVQDLTT